MSQDPIVITGFARTPMGGLQGVFSTVKATELGGAAVRAAVVRSRFDPTLVEQIIMGCVLPAGLGQAPARQAAIHAGLGEHVEASTVNKMCGSGMQAVMFARDLVVAGAADIVMAGGMESMTGAPYLLAKHRGGARIGHDVVKDSMFLDGLEEAYCPGKLMGAFAEDTVGLYQLTREDQAAYAVTSLTRAQAAKAAGRFDEEIVAVEVAGLKGVEQVSIDEQPGKADAARIPTMKPAFAATGRSRRPTRPRFRTAPPRW